MNIRKLIYLFVALLPFGSVNSASADDFTDLVKAVTKGPRTGPELADMIGVVTGKKMPAAKTKKAHRVAVNMTALTEAMAETGSYDGILDAMVMESALDASISDGNRPKDYGKNNSNIIFPVHNYPLDIAEEYAPEFVRPVSGSITSMFGYRSSFGRMHKGIDLRLNVGDTVRAAMSGTVAHVGYDRGGYGNYIILKHSNGVETRYGHLKHSFVSEGMYVGTGFPIALGGNTGNSTGPHLHFETRVMGVAMDPMMMFDLSAPVTYRRASYSPRRYTPNNKEVVFIGNSEMHRATYVVRSGDTLSSIARRTGISISRICRLNSLSSTDVPEPGRMLKLR